MEHKPLSPAVKFAHHYCLEPSQKRLAIDATFGNGHDTLFLAQHYHKVIGFDIQPLAFRRASKRLLSTKNVTLILADHATLRNHVSAPIDLLLFNLGFLPGGNRHITTHIHTVLQVIDSNSNQMSKDSRIILVIYTQHNQCFDVPIVREYLSHQPFFFVIEENFGNEIVVILYPHRKKS